MERSGARTRQYQESVQRPSPQHASPEDKVEYIRRREGLPAVMARRGSESSPSGPLPQKPALRTKRSFMHWDRVLDSGLSPQFYPAVFPYRPQRSRPLSKVNDIFQLSPMLWADRMPAHANSGRERETASSSRKPQKSSGLGRTEWTDEMPTSSSPTPERVLPPHSVKYPYQ